MTITASHRLHFVIPRGIKGDLTTFASHLQVTITMARFLNANRNTILQEVQKHRVDGRKICVVAAAPFPPRRP